MSQSEEFETLNKHKNCIKPWGLEAPFQMKLKISHLLT